MLQIVFMVIGIVYVFKLIGLGNAAAKLGLPPEALAEWRHNRIRQYVWGIVAGWGSFLVTIIVALATIDPNRSYSPDDALSAQMPSLLIGLAVLIVGIVLSSRAGGRAKAIELQNAASRVDAPG